MAQRSRQRWQQTTATPPAPRVPEAADVRPFADPAVVADQIAAVTAANQPATVPVSGIGQRDEVAADRLARQMGGSAPQPVGRQNSAAEAHQVDATIMQNIDARRSSGRPLPDAVRSSAEQRSGHSFSDVRIHADQAADQLSRGLGARAFTSGRDIFFERGSFLPQSTAGRALIHHELGHTVQQRTSDTPQIQRAVGDLPKTADALIAATGAKGSILFSTSSYEKLIDAMRAYEKLVAADSAEARKGERLKLVMRIIDLIDRWMTSNQRKFNNDAATDKKGDKEKFEALKELRAGAVTESERLKFQQTVTAGVVSGYSKAMPTIPTPPAPVTSTASPPAPVTSTASPPAPVTSTASPPAPSTSTASPPAPVTSTASPPAPVTAPPTPAPVVPYKTRKQVELENAATAAAAQRQGFFLRNAARVANFFKTAFGSDFTSKERVALDPKQNLNAFEIEYVIKMLDTALGHFNGLIIAAPTADRNQLMELSFDGLPDQLIPTDGSPKAILVVRTRRQMLQEMLTLVRNAEDKSAAAMARGNAFYATPGSSGATPGAPGEGEGVLSKARTPLDLINSGSDITAAVGDFMSEDWVGFGSGPGAILNNILRLIESLKNVMSSISALRAVAADKRDDAIKDLLVQIEGTLTQGTKVSGAIAKVATLGSGIPGLEIAADAADAVANILEALKRAKRAYVEKQLIRTEKGGGDQAGTVDALKNLQSRNKTLVIRNVIEVITLAVKIVGNSIKLGDPSGAGALVGAVAGCVSVAAKAAAGVKDSYRAGVAQQTEQETLAGKAGADLRIFKDNASWAVTAIIVAAKDGDASAKAALNNYGISDADIGTKSAKELRAIILQEIEDSENPQTMIQRLRRIVGKNTDRMALEEV